MESSNFWKSLPKPITAMAPMAGVTDAAFRFMVAKYSKYKGKDIGEYGKEDLEELESGGPHLIYTEFVSADGLFLGGREEIIKDMKYSEAERPIVAQFFSSDPERMKKCASLAYDLGFDGVDINFGCPDRTVCKQGAGSEIIKNPELAKEIVEKVKEGSKGLPVSVKTRAGYVTDGEMEEWIGTVLKTKPSALVLHARTRNDMYKRPARWGLVKKAVEMRDRLKSETLILGNGDISSMDDLYIKVEESNADGAMVGRALFGNPWFFHKDISLVSVEERLRVLVEHAELFEEIFSKEKNFAHIKKHFRGYVSGWSGAKELRTKLMSTENSEELKKVIYIINHPSTQNKSGMGKIKF